MDAIKLLTSDHATVRDLFKRFRSAHEADDTDAMRELQRQIFDELETHTRIEEDLFYPAVRDLGIAELTEAIDESIQEHHVIKVLMREIKDLSDQDVFEAKMTVLIENTEHHIEEEETEMFVETKEHMDGSDLDRLGEELETAKGE